MTFRAWWRGWVARVWGDDPIRVRLRGRPTTVLVLDRLPERDVPSAVDEPPPAPPADAPPPPAASEHPPTVTISPAAGGVMWDAVGYTPPTFLNIVAPPVHPAVPRPPSVVADERPDPPSVPPSVPPPAPPAARPTAPSPGPANVVVTTTQTESAPPPAKTYASVGEPAAKPKDVGRSVARDVPAFRISGLLPPGETVRVNYTLAAHDGTGTTAVSGTVTLTPAVSVATIPATAVPTARPPELYTLVVGDQPVSRPAPPASATLFVTPPPLVGDAALIEAHRVGGSAEAFGVLVRRHGPAVARAAERVVGNRADAQDVSQRVFLELARYRGRVTGTLTAWLRAVSRNTALAFLRAKRRRVRHELQAAMGEAVAAAPQEALDEGLTSALAQLPPDLGQAVRLRYLDGYTQQEAAELAGVPRGTLSRRAADGLRALRALLADGEHSSAGRQ